MLDLYMMELRLSGREEPMASKSFGASLENLDEEELEELFDESRQMVGDDQYQWLTDGIKNSEAKWKLMGSSVMMTSFPTLFNADAWDGYYAQRERLFNYILDNDIKNIGTISGDIHMSFAADLITKSYTDLDNAELVGFEFTTPSVSSANINELTILPYPDPETGETKIIFPLQDRLPERSDEVVALEEFLVESNEWINYINSDQHGYIMLDITEEKMQSDWYHVGDVRDFENDEESATMSIAVNSGDPKMQFVDTPTPDKENAPKLAPFPGTSSVESDKILNMGVYPNPVVNTAMVNFAINKTQSVQIAIYSISGEKVLEIANTTFTNGVHGIPFNADGLISGVYLVKIETENGSKSMKFVK
jgi:alkaline phosphatase D